MRGIHIKLLLIAVHTVFVYRVERWVVVDIYTSQKVLIQSSKDHSIHCFKQKGGREILKLKRKYVARGNYYEFYHGSFCVARCDNNDADYRETVEALRLAGYEL